MSLTKFYFLLNVMAAATTGFILMNLKSAFPDFDKKLVDHLLRVSDSAVIPAGEALLRPGQYFKNTILVLDGRVKLYAEGPRGEEYFLYYLEKGSACALSFAWLFRNEASQVKASAATSVTVLMVPWEHMDALIREHPKWYQFLLETYHSRFQELLLIINQIAFHPMEEKLEYYLRQLFKSARSRSISVTHQEIATDLNSSREVISRLLKKLELERRIEISRNEITNIAL